MPQNVLGGKPSRQGTYFWARWVTGLRLLLPSNHSEEFVHPRFVSISSLAPAGDRAKRLGGVEIQSVVAEFRVIGQTGAKWHAEIAVVKMNQRE
jgi:hypothetical protein